MNKYITHHGLKIIGSALVAGVVLFSGETSPTLAQPAAAASAGPNLSVDAAAGNYLISPDIYGMSWANDTQISSLPLPVNRWGGNAVSRYNYQTNISNHAIDWYFENILEDGGSSNLPSNSAANRFIEANNASHTRTVLTVPTMGWVSNSNAGACSYLKSAYPNQDEFAPDRTQCGRGSNGNVYLTGNSPSLTSIAAPPSFVQTWVAYLKTRYGTSAPTYYALDNEPDLWNDTHHDVHPIPMGYDDMRDMAYAYGPAVKAGNPSAKVLGPDSWGWTGYFYSAADWTSDDHYAWINNPPDRNAHGGKEFVAWYLEQMHQYELDHGTRILDYLDLHFYTQALYNGANPVTLGDAGGPVTKDARLRSTRDLWDPTYKEQDDGSWIDQPVMLIPRMHAWVDNNYPGTQIAITEYNWGGLEDINGALAEADVLGIFGREKVDLAALWDPPNPGQPGEYAFRMYLNYDGGGGHFGDRSIQSTSGNQSKLSIYGSKDSASGDLKLMVINKTNGALTSSVGLSNFTPSTFMNTYTYSPSNLGAIVAGWQPVSGSSISYTFPAESITLLVVPPDGSPVTPPASALHAPVPTSPKNNAALYKTVTKLAWKKLKGALSYSVQVEDALGNLVFGATPKKNAASAPLAYGRYSWKVQALARDGLTAFSPTRTFDVTLLTAPKKGATLRASKVVFKWKGVKNATYHLEVWKDRGLPGETQVIDQDGWTKTSFRPPTLLEPGAYSWTVTVNGQTMPEWTLTVTP